MARAKKGFLIIGNWKMNPDTREEASALFSAVARAAKQAAQTAVAVAAPMPFIAELARKGSPVALIAQDVSEHPSGSFTGSVSAREAQSIGAEYALVGHSDRRRAGDTEATVSAKAARAVEAGLRIVACVGEEERDGHARYLKAVRDQVLSIIAAVGPKNARSVIFAYEPVWAVGKSYDTALKPAEIHEMSIYIKKVAIEALGKKEGLKATVLYGGSVDAENAKHILRDASIDGLLIGRQSLDPKAFSEIIQYADSL
ncbi:MAG TPA: triose-phosphate isomerase family protein [Candidatus Paceibacterota bacterium]|nr:triose-phosphate isomerase family protein [Candidatus Paceibacterota bacterium]